MCLAHNCLIWCTLINCFFVQNITWWFVSVRCAIQQTLEASLALNSHPTFHHRGNHIVGSDFPARGNEMVLPCQTLGRSLRSFCCQPDLISGESGLIFCCPVWSLKWVRRDKSMTPKSAFYRLPCSSARCSVSHQLHFLWNENKSRSNSHRNKLYSPWNLSVGTKHCTRELPSNRCQTFLFFYFFRNL